MSVTAARLEDDHTPVARSVRLIQDVWSCEGSDAQRAETGTGSGAGWAGVCDKQQTGRGLHRQLEGIRVSDRDLSDAAVAVAD